MADLHRLVRLWLLACLSLVSLGAQAFDPVDKWVGSKNGQTYTSPSACLSAQKSKWDSEFPGHVGCRTWSDTGITVTDGVRGIASELGGCAGGAVWCTATAQKACPANSTQDSNGNCTCDSGYHERTVDGQKACVKPDDRTPKQLCQDAASHWNSTLNSDRSMRVGGPLSQYADGAATCAQVNGMPDGQGCKHWFTGDLGFKDDQGKSWTNGFSIALDEGDPRANGSLVCSLADGSQPPKENPQPEDCRQGYKTTVMGVELCIEDWTGETEGNDRDQTTDGNGNKSTTKTNIKCVGDQCKVTETTTTTKPDGTTSTTTTTTEGVNRQAYCARNPESAICRRQDDKDGGDKGPATRNPGGGNGDGEGDGFCEENPDSPICKKSTWGGSCAWNFQCDGDAIQCAMAKEQHIRACKLFDDASPESALYESNKNKEGAQTKDLPGSREESMANRVSTADAFGGGGQCIQDLNIAVMGQAVSLPMSKVCPIVGVIGNIMIGVALLLAVRIVGRG
ncbi:virulence factor TspB C-terminal domain-related protein [Acidovorax sp. sic0104]|uniref:virulence factor TspB C-terminal domain-related protein n=1 Tax=Acidovorax sp. sic0104 TaxID=2854784 RepID=UPI001C47F292|nr:virulence factor TspB C-terminal domain-related protein [Acidovorax sp. sic0104]MBV7540000.1 hypothetical protein [Acidovorax sp. sic0104]